MFVLTARLTKKRAVLWVLAAGAVLVLLILLAGHLHGSGSKSSGQLDTNESRIDYLQSYGWEVNSEPVTTLQLMMPDTLEEPYLSYNELQKKQGLDLSAACGKQVSRYTYTVTNFPGRPDGVQADLYLCEGKPVAGDILCTGENGFQQGLTFPSNETRT